MKANGDREITTSQLKNARNSFLFAESLGYPLNTFITIRLNLLGGSRGWKKGVDASDQVPTLRQMLRTAIRRWCNRTGFQFVWIECIENSAGHGPHIHALLHLPEGSRPSWDCRKLPEFQDPTWTKNQRSLSDFLDRLSGVDPTRLAIERSKIEDRKEASLPILVCANHLPHDVGSDDALTKLAYMCKCHTPHEIVHQDDKGRITSLSIHQRDGMITIGKSSDVYCRKRIFASENVAIKARQLSGWKEEEGLEWLDRSFRRDRLKASATKQLSILLDTGVIPY